MLAVHVRINDSVTGKPTAVRLRITGPDGTHYAPFGCLREFASGRNEDVGGHLLIHRERYCYIDGSCEVRLPAEVPLRIQAFKGPEYRPVDETVILGPGKMALRLTIQRWSNIREARWYPGDTRVHSISPHSARLEAEAEDVSVVQILAGRQTLSGQDGHVYFQIPNMTAFSGQQPALQNTETLVAVNTLNVHPILGAVGLLHCHRAVFPLTFGGSEETDDWSLVAWCNQCHRKNGLVVWVRPFEAEHGIPGGEALIAALLGKIDAIEYDGVPRKQPFLPSWYRLLDAGFPIPLVGSSGKNSNTMTLGKPRTYARLLPDEPLTLSSWIEAVRAGRTFVTNGPIMTFQVDDLEPGQTVEHDAQERSIHITSTVKSFSHFERLEIVANHTVIASSPAVQSETGWSAEIDQQITIRESSWIAARCTTTTGSTNSAAENPFAHTSAIVVRLGGTPLPNQQPAREMLRISIEKTREWIENHGRFEDVRRKSQLIELCDSALLKLAD